MTKTPKDLKTYNRESGSAAVSGVIGIFVLGIATLYVQTMGESTSRVINQNKRDRATEATHTGSMSSVSRFKALLTGGSSTAYKPAVYANNYFQAIWTLKENTAGGAVVDIKGPNVHLGSVETDSEIEQYVKVMKGERTAAKTADGPRTIHVLNTNFSGDGLIAESIDVKVTKAGSPPSAFRINLTIPQPSGVKLELSPAGANNFKEVTSVGPGAYDIRVLSSGIAYKAVVKIGSEEHVLGIEKDSGKISHALVNPYVVDREIGRFKHTFAASSSKATMDPATCSVSVTGLGSGDVPIQVAVYGVDKLVSEGNQLSTVVKVAGGSQPGPEVSDEVAANSCDDQCKYYEPSEFEDSVSARWANGDYGDYSQHLNINKDRREWNMMDKKICVSAGKVAANFQAKYGRPLTDHRLIFQMSLEDEMQMIAYSLPSCKREFLFNRGTCGCFAEETKILLGDQQTEKPISQLTEFDQVWNPILKRSMPIKRMTKGPEKYPMLEVKVGGKVLNVTGNHPFPTSEGVMAAYQLNPGQSILAENGEWQPIESVEADSQNKGKDVWNLELDAARDKLENHYVLANGVITGDLYIQESLGK